MPWFAIIICHKILVHVQLCIYSDNNAWTMWFTLRCRRSVYVWNENISD
jgi:hypothetical protein